jgi:hypothetical protein
MIEMRILLWPNQEVLQFRYSILCVDGSGALCPTDHWSEWKDVPKYPGGEIKKLEASQ